LSFTEREDGPIALRLEPPRILHLCAGLDRYPFNALAVEIVVHGDFGIWTLCLGHDHPDGDRWLDLDPDAGNRDRGTVRWEIPGAPLRMEAGKGIALEIDGGAWRNPPRRPWGFGWTADWIKRWRDWRDPPECTILVWLVGHVVG
jgi:hypothetical protein